MLGQSDLGKHLFGDIWRELWATVDPMLNLGEWLSMELQFAVILSLLYDGRG